MTRDRHRSASSVVSLVIVLLLMTGCTFLPQRHSGAETSQCLLSLDPSSVATGVFVAPDDRETPIVNELDAAACAIDVSVYLLTSETIMTTLENAADRGVRVRVMLEEHPFGGGGSQNDVRGQLESHGIEVRWASKEFRFSHAKFIVIDSRVAVIMNLNLTTAAFTENREFGAVTTDPAAVHQAQAIFDLDWTGGERGYIDGPLIVSPATSRERYTTFINEAMDSIDFYAEVIRDDEIVRSLVAARQRGVRIRLIVDVSIDAASWESLARLEESGVEVRTANFLYIHAKLMIIDGAFAIIGSQNFTATSLDQNRELALVIEDPLLVARCASVFGRDWQRSTSRRDPRLDRLHSFAVPTSITYK